MTDDEVRVALAHARMYLASGQRVVTKNQSRVVENLANELLVTRKALRELMDVMQEGDPMLISNALDLWTEQEDGQQYGLSITGERTYKALTAAKALLDATRVPS